MGGRGARRKAGGNRGVTGVRAARAAIRMETGTGTDAETRGGCSRDKEDPLMGAQYV